MGNLRSIYSSSLREIFCCDDVYGGYYKKNIVKIIVYVRADDDFNMKCILFIYLLSKIQIVRLFTSRSAILKYIFYWHVSNIQLIEFDNRKEILLYANCYHLCKLFKNTFITCNTPFKACN